MSFFLERKDAHGRTIWVTDSSFPRDNMRSGLFSLSTGKLEISTDDVNLVRSSKLFRKAAEIAVKLCEILEDDFAIKIRAHAHSSKEIQGQMIQKIEGIVQPQLLHGKSFSEQRDEVAAKLDSSQAAETLLYLQKRIVELGAHMVSFELLHLNDEIELSKNHHNIRRLILNVWHAFDDNRESTGLNLKFHFDNDEAESNKVFLDYKIFNAALYNFLNNTFKYAHPHTDIHVDFSHNLSTGEFELIFSMRSLRVEPDELDSIFDLGKRGKNARERGNGIGMFVVKKALNLNGFNIHVRPEYSDRRDWDRRQYIWNRFFVTGRSEIW